PRFARNRARCVNRVALDAIVRPILAAKPSVWWLRVLRRGGVPCSIAHDFEGFRYHQQIIDNAMIADVTTPQWGSVSVGGLPWHFAETPCEIRPPSIPGADSEAILSGLNIVAHAGGITG
ncbi:MAG TPA: CoA transferase, partial [Devosia sp.]|nr:CoA transferase [Devosia sp.]